MACTQFIPTDILSAFLIVGIWFVSMIVICEITGPR